MNKNRKGFTLVELIVVVTIFGVILGAILNMIKPANTFIMTLMQQWKAMS